MVVSVLTGVWDGMIDTGAVRLRCSLQFSASGSDISAILEVVDQAATIAVSKMEFDRDTVRLECARAIVVEARLIDDGNTLEGFWIQSGRRTPLVLSRRAADAEAPTLRRPQMPEGPFPYRERDCVIASPNADVRLAGTLTLPEGAGPFPAVILIHGSGPHDRDETIFGHKIFLVIADHLSRRGIAVLRYDKRGVGQSSGNYAHATTAGFADDAAAALSYLRGRPAIDPDCIGVVGHSEGGLIAPMLAFQEPSPAFMILLAAPATSGAEVLVDQIASMDRTRGASDEEILAKSGLNRRLFAAIGSATDTAEAQRRAREILAASASSKSEIEINYEVKHFTSNWYRHFMIYDPVPALRQVRCPVLAVIGANDLQVPPAKNMAVIESALAGNPDVETMVVPGLNHLFQTCQTGDTAEYGVVEETIAPHVLDLLSTWIGRRVARNAGSR